MTGRRSKRLLDERKLHPDMDTLGLALWGSLHTRAGADDDVVAFWLTACLDYWLLHERPRVGLWVCVIPSPRERGRRVRSKK